MTIHSQNDVYFKIAILNTVKWSTTNAQLNLIFVYFDKSSSAIVQSSLYFC